jgi:hypothetical protein
MPPENGSRISSQNDAFIKYTRDKEQSPKQYSYNEWTVVTNCYRITPYLFCHDSQAQGKFHFYFCIFSKYYIMATNLQMLITNISLLVHAV